MLKDTIWCGNEISIIIISNYLVPRAPGLSQVFLPGWKLLFVHEIKQTVLLKEAGGRGSRGAGREPALPCLWARKYSEYFSEESVAFEESELGIISLMQLRQDEGKCGEGAKLSQHPYLFTTDCQAETLFAGLCHLSDYWRKSSLVGDELSHLSRSHQEFFS